MNTFLYSTRLFCYRIHKKLRWNGKTNVLLCTTLLLVLTFIILNEKYAWKLIFEQECIDKREPHQFFDSNGRRGCLSAVWNRYTYSLSESDAALLNLDIQSQCAKVVRYGHYDDGGWVICADDFQPKKLIRSTQSYWERNNADSLDPREAHPCIVYSFGINDDPSFDKDLSRRWPSCTIYAFDPSIGRKSGDKFLGSNIKFYNIGLGGENKSRNNKNWKIMTLDSIMDMLNHQHINLLKMDIEGDEWETFKSWQKSGVYKKIGQLVGEIHFLKPDGLMLDDKLDTLKLMKDKFGLHVFRRQDNIRYAEPTRIRDSLRAYSCIEVGWRRIK